MADSNHQGENSRGWYPQMGRARAPVEAIEMFRSRGSGQRPLSPPLGGHGRDGAPALLWQLVTVNHTHTTSSIPHPRERGLGSLSPPCPSREAGQMLYLSLHNLQPPILGEPGVGLLALHQHLPPPYGIHIPSPNAYVSMVASLPSQL